MDPSHAIVVCDWMRLWERANGSPNDPHLREGTQGKAREGTGIHCHTLVAALPLFMLRPPAKMKMAGEWTRHLRNHGSYKDNRLNPSLINRPPSFCSTSFTSDPNFLIQEDRPWPSCLGVNGPRTQEPPVLETRATPQGRVRP